MIIYQTEPANERFSVISTDDFLTAPSDFSRQKQSMIARIYRLSFNVFLLQSQELQQFIKIIFRV